MLVNLNSIVAQQIDASALLQSNTTPELEAATALGPAVSQLLGGDESTPLVTDDPYTFAFSEASAAIEFAQSAQPPTDEIGCTIEAQEGEQNSSVFTITVNVDPTVGYHYDSVDDSAFAGLFYGF